MARVRASSTRLAIGATRRPGCVVTISTPKRRTVNTGEGLMPTNDLTPGLKEQIVTTVDDKRGVSPVGVDGVLATPSMIGLMERAVIQGVQPHLPEGHTTVGFEVNVKHFGATPKGKKVTVRAELLEVDGRKIRFKADAA